MFTRLKRERAFGLAAVVPALFLGVASPVVPARGADGLIDPRSLLPRRHTTARGLGFPGGLGLVPSTEEQFDKTSHVRTVTLMKRGVRPEKVLLTDYLPPVASQGSQGSCVGWSTAYYHYTYEIAEDLQLKPEQLATDRFRFSPAFIYHLGNNGKDEGMQLAKAFELLKERGCATLAEMPYKESDATSLPSSDADRRAQKYHARKVAHLYRSNPDPDMLKTWLADTHRPFVAAILIFTDFPKGKVDPDFVYDVSIPPVKQNTVGAHAVTIVGYDDTKKAFRMVNSWGPWWGDKGFIWLAEDYVRKYSFEGWGDEPGGPTVRTPIPRHVILEPPAKRSMPGVHAEATHIGATHTGATHE